MVARPSFLSLATFCMALFPGVRLAVFLARWQCLFPSFACLFHFKFTGAIFFFYCARVLCSTDDAWSASSSSAAGK